MTLRLLPALPGIVYPVKKTPIWSTDVQRAVSAKVTTLQRWSYPIYAFEVGYEFLRSDTAWGEYQDLLAFYNLAGGRAGLWRFKDAMDYRVTAQGFGLGDGATLSFQLVRAIGGLTLAWVDPVFFPEQINLQVFINGVLQTSGFVCSETGLVTFAVAPAVGALLTWTGTFNWLVRFDEDSATFEQFTYNLFELKQLKFTSEKI